MALVEVKVPDIGDFESVDVIEVLVKPGDTIRAEQSLVTVESDKASMEIPSSTGGVVKELKVALGDKISKGSPLLMLETAGSGEASDDASTGQVSESASQKADAEAVSESDAKAPAPGSGPPPSAASDAPAQAADAPARPGAPVEARVPDIGDFNEVTVIEVLVAPGDMVALDQSLITVESDKASMEIPSTQAGRVTRISVQVGDKVSKGSLLALVEPAVAAAVNGPSVQVVAPASPSANAAPGTAAAARTPPTAALPEPEPTMPPGTLPHASPSIRKLARELGVPLAEVRGSGPKGRITQDDVRSFVQGVMRGAVQTKAQAATAPAAQGALAGLLPWPQVDYAKFGPVERRDLSRIKKLAAANLHRNWVLIPHVTNHDDADVTDLEALRIQINRENEKSGVKVTMLAFLIKACVAALRKFPDFNASLDGNQLVLKQYMHIGFAADTPNGLVVPVIRDADRKGVLQLSTELAELAKKAREGKLGGAEMSGGCFSISSLGGIGGRYFTPIINAPEVAILGVGKTATEPVWDGSAFQPRLRLPLSLSWDHRVVDGASAARFNAYLCQVLADFRRVLL